METSRCAFIQAPSRPGSCSSGTHNRCARSKFFRTGSSYVPGAASCSHEAQGGLREQKRTRLLQFARSLPKMSTTMPNRPLPASESIVERVTLQIDCRQARPAVAVTNALVPYRPQNAAPARVSASPASPASPRSPSATKLARVQLRLLTRPAQPHELAAAPGTPGTPVLASEEDDAAASDRPVSVLLDDGSRVVCTSKTLAQHSSVLGMLVGSGTWREAATGEVALREHPAEVVRGVLAWMAAEAGPPKRIAAAALISPELVVEVARLSHYLDCQPLLRAALIAIGGALDVENAPSCLLLARELGAAELEQRAVGFIL